MTAKMTLKQQLVKTILNLEWKFNEGKFAEVDVILFDLDVETETPEMLITYIRTCYCARKNLREWSGLVRRTHTEFLARGLDANKLLRGVLSVAASEEIFAGIGKPLC